MKKLVIILSGIFLTIAIVGGMLSIKISNQSAKKDQKPVEPTQANTPAATPIKPDQNLSELSPSKQFPPQPTDSKPEQTPVTQPQQKNLEQPTPPEANQNRGNYNDMIDAYRI
jgi:hypothetical protein